MSEAPSVAAFAPGRESDSTVVDADAEVATLLAVLEDPDCRRILDATGDEPLCATELMDRCDVPRSTLYRKLEVLTEQGLLEERIRLRRSGKHASEYVRLVDDVHVSLDTQDGVAIEITHRETPSETGPVVNTAD